MSAYGLIKATSRAMRSDTITDLIRVNNWLSSKWMMPISPMGQSLRRLENSVALGLEGLDLAGLEKLERGADFYISILPEIKLSEREHFVKLNRLHPLNSNRV